MVVNGGDLHCGVLAAGRRAADEQRQLEGFTLHLPGNMGHLIERRRDQPAQANHVHILLAGGLQDLVAWHHHAEVDDLVVIALQHHADDIFSDVMHVALDSGHENLST